MLRVLILTDVHKYKSVYTKYKTLNVQFKVSVEKKDITKLIEDFKPNVFVSVGAKWSDFSVLNELPIQLRKKWIHYTNIVDINYKDIKNTYMNWAMNSHNIKVSFVTTTNNNFKTIDLLYKSIKSQTLTDWEWVIFDNSPDDKFPKLLNRLRKTETRIRFFTSGLNDIYGGSKIKNACMLSRGDVIIEAEVDCILHPNTAEKVSQVFDSGDGKIGFVTAYSSDCVVKNEGWGLGYGYNYIQGGCSKNGGWETINVTPRLTSRTIQSFVSIPNKLKCWDAKLYKSLGGHNERIIDCQHYELFCRMFCSSKIAYIPDTLHTQKSGKCEKTLNSSQELSIYISKQYKSRLSDRVNQLGFNDYTLYKGNHVKFDWEVDIPDINQCLNSYMSIDEKCVSVVIPTYNRPSHIVKALDSLKTQTYTNWVVYVIGDKCPTIKKTLSEYVKGDTYDWNGKLKWWNLSRHYGEGGAMPRNYALKGLVKTDMIALLDDDNTIRPTHIESLVKVMIESNARYVFSSFAIDDVSIRVRYPAYGRINTSCVLFRRELLEIYGYWRQCTPKFYWHDFEFFSRWEEGGELWAYTDCVTMDYCTDFCDVDVIKIKDMYDDQQEGVVINREMYSGYQNPAVPYSPKNVYIHGLSTVDEGEGGGEALVDEGEGGGEALVDEGGALGGGGEEITEESSDVSYTLKLLDEYDNEYIVQYEDI